MARKKKGPPPFIMICPDLRTREGTDTERTAINAGSRYLAQRWAESDEVGVYKLVKVVRRKVAPVEVEAVSI